MKLTELLTKAGFYFALPTLVVFSDNLADMTDWTWDIETCRKLLILPLIGGLTAIKAYFSSTYAKYQNGKPQGKDPQG